MAGGPLRRAWRAFVDRTGWTTPTRSEVATVAKAALAASVAWVVADAVTQTPDPVLAPLAALICVRVSVHASVRHALQRSAAVVLGVLVAVAIGDAIGLNALTVGLLVGVSLAVAQLLLRLPRQAANQVPVSVLVVMAALATTHHSHALERAANTAIGAGVGAALSIALPASRLKSARQNLDRLGSTLGGVLEEMADGLRRPWTAKQSGEWRTKARAARDRLVSGAKDAIGSGHEAAQWNIRDRRHIDELTRYEQALPNLDRTAIGVSSIARGLDDDARRAPGSVLPPMQAMSSLLASLALLVRTVVRRVLDSGGDDQVGRGFAEVEAARELCAQAASRRAHGGVADAPAVEWMTYAALLVQVDRIVEDLRASPSA